MATMLPELNADGMVRVAPAAEIVTKMGNQIVRDQDHRRPIQRIYGRGAELMHMFGVRTTSLAASWAKPPFFHFRTFQIALCRHSGASADEKREPQRLAALRLWRGLSALSQERIDPKQRRYRIQVRFRRCVPSDTGKIGQST
jgi:hypothetical protein